MWITPIVQLLLLVMLMARSTTMTSTTREGPFIDDPHLIEFGFSEDDEKTTVLGVSEEVHEAVDGIHADGSYSFSYSSSDGTKRSEKGYSNGPTASIGTFSYIGPDGRNYTVYFEAGTNGFNPVGDHLPTPPALPYVLHHWHVMTTNQVPVVTLPSIPQRITITAVKESLTETTTEMPNSSTKEGKEHSETSDLTSVDIFTQASQETSDHHVTKSINIKSEDGYETTATTLPEDSTILAELSDGSNIEQLQTVNSALVTSNEAELEKTDENFSANTTTTTQSSNLEYTEDVVLISLEDQEFQNDSTFTSSKANPKPTTEMSPNQRQSETKDNLSSDNDLDHGNNHVRDCQKNNQVESGLDNNPQSGDKEELSNVSLPQSESEQHLESPFANESNSEFDRRLNSSTKGSDTNENSELPNVTVTQLIESVQNEKKTDSKENSELSKSTSVSDSIQNLDTIVADGDGVEMPESSTVLTTQGELGQNIISSSTTEKSVESLESPGIDTTLAESEETLKISVKRDETVLSVDFGSDKSIDKDNNEGDKLTHSESDQNIENEDSLESKEDDVKSVPVHSKELEKLLDILALQDKDDNNPSGHNRDFGLFRSVFDNIGKTRLSAEVDSAQTDMEHFQSWVENSEFEVVLDVPEALSNILHGEKKEWEIDRHRLRLPIFFERKRRSRKPNKIKHKTSIYSSAVTMNLSLINARQLSPFTDKNETLKIHPCFWLVFIYVVMTQFFHLLNSVRP